MCKSQADGGQRCAAHTRQQYEKAPDGPEKYEAAADYATTAEGWRVLQEEVVAARKAAEEEGPLSRRGPALARHAAELDAVRARVNPLRFRREAEREAVMEEVAAGMRTGALVDPANRPQVSREEPVYTSFDDFVAAVGGAGLPTRRPGSDPSEEPAPVPTAAKDAERGGGAWQRWMRTRRNPADESWEAVGEEPAPDVSDWSTGLR